MLSRLISELALGFFFDFKVGKKNGMESVSCDTFSEPLAMCNIFINLNGLCLDTVAGVATAAFLLYLPQTVVLFLSCSEVQGYKKC